MANAGTHASAPPSVTRTDGFIHVKAAICKKISYLDKMTVGIVYKSIVSNMKTEQRIKILHPLPVYVEV